MAERGVPMNDNEESNKKNGYSPAGPDENVEREPVFYYSREHRLDRASTAVRDLNENKPVKKSVAKNLFGSRSNVMVFIMMIITCVILSFVSKYSQASKNAKLGGNTVIMTILKEEEMLILDIIKQSPETGKAYAGDVEIAVSPVMSKLQEGETPPLFFHRVTFSYTGYEDFQILLPFSIDEKDFLVLLRTSEEQKSVKLSAR
jgi:hypothetical protein